ncbi:antitoxin Xre/MbcA/ParS toxin-binding domain-containing protein [Pseudomonas lundensis]|jgi:hypothetical protein|uniref:antitoxin Xre/MbcA/ParS toxin-binding domain-containing protein n=1 Tax=Pseudomonas lundensis TaxID=86185 RepID=UPI00193C7B6E|nr:antitoxin Xre/MbcA/ParS toxin-binding domain-containing protein [Pseudomonas lundensis]MBM1183728.1 DUF2384 domain-containing protein [Pseudomonas lundensis]
MLITLELNFNDSEALLDHCTGYHPDSEDCRHNHRLSEALKTLAVAIKDAINTKPVTAQSADTVAPKLMEAARRLFDNDATALEWLHRPLRALGEERPVDVDLEIALDLMGRLEHGFGA